MENVLSYDEFRTRLLTELNELMPLTEEEREYLEELAVWTRRTEKLVKRYSNDEGMTQSEVRRAFGEHNTTKPRRKQGRPKSALPPRHYIDEQLNEFLIGLGLHTLPPDPGPQLRALAQRILREATPPAAAAD